MKLDTPPLTFTENSAAIMDDDGRLVFPQKWREALAEHEISVLLLSDGSEFQLAVFPCPLSTLSPPLLEANPAWGDMFPFGVFSRHVDPKGRFTVPFLFQESCTGKQLSLVGCQTHLLVQTRLRQN